VNYATLRARLLLGCYRTGDANDADTYVSAIAATLAHFPEHVITQVTHPVLGLPSRCKWLPSVSEVREACDAIMEPIIEKRRHQERVENQFEERRTFYEERARPRPTLEQLKEKYGENFGLDPAFGEPKKAVLSAPNADQLRHHYAHYKLAFEPKDQSEAAE
jgi:hypothetical protein